MTSSVLGGCLVEALFGVDKSQLEMDGAHGVVALRAFGPKACKHICLQVDASLSCRTSRRNVLVEFFMVNAVAVIVFCAVRFDVVVHRTGVGQDIVVTLRRAAVSALREQRHVAHEIAGAQETTGSESAHIERCSYAPGVELIFR